jgi:hypothetical protein
MTRYLFTFTLILLAAFTRVLPHPPNVAPITALALFGGVYLDRKLTFVVPLLAMLIADYFIGFHSTMAWVYSSFIAIGFIGLWLRNHRGVVSTIGASLAGSILFFVVTNYGVWMGSMQTYPHTAAGLAACYTAALPFFRNTLLGDLAYTGILFGAYEAARRHIPALRTQSVEA